MVWSNMRIRALGHAHHGTSDQACWLAEAFEPLPCLLSITTYITV